MSTSSPPSRRYSLPFRARLATTVGGAAGRASRLAGRGDGSVIGGVIGLRLKPDLLSLLARGRQVVLVTGTNGKTTTTRLITAALGALGQQIASNAFGANMEAGLVSALAKAPDATLAVLEVDEKYMPAMLTATSARVVVLLNLSRDQMDRAAEIWMLARRWRAALAAAQVRVIANADDPLLPWAAGQARQVPGGAAGRGRPLDLALPGRANRSNAVVAFAVAEVFGIGVTQAMEPVRQVRSVAGRYTQVERNGTALRLLLAKNPAGWLEALDVLVPPPVPVLLAVNAQTPDGKDTSWLWDVDYRRLRGRPVFVAGERQLDLAVRLEADEVAFWMVGSIDEAVEQARSPSMEVIANYTAFQQIRAALGRAV